jgi:hypothetical protein
MIPRLRLFAGTPLSNSMHLVLLLVTTALAVQDLRWIGQPVGQLVCSYRLI